MKIILVIFLYITSAQCGILKDLNKNDASTGMDENQGQLMRVTDVLVKENVTFVTEILLDVTKDKETHKIYNTTPIFPGESGDESEFAKFESGTSYYHLLVTPGLHVWDVKFHVSEAAEEVNRVNSIVEAAAIKTGQLVGKNCTNYDIFAICLFYINVYETNQPLSKTEIELQNKTLPADEDETKDNPEVVNTPANQTDKAAASVFNCTATITVNGEVYSCGFATSEALVGGCPAGTARAEDNSCAEIID